MAPDVAGTDLLLVPSYSADQRTLASIDGLDSWVERHLIELRHLLQPGHRMVLVSPTPISPACLDAVLGLIPGVPSAWLRERLNCLCLNDRSPIPLTEKLLARPLLLEQLRSQLRPGARLGCYAVSDAEMDLAQRLGLELEGTPSSHGHLGSKAGSAQVFAALGMAHPRTTPLCHSLSELGEACESLLRRHRQINSLVVKLNRMAGGRGNAPLALELTSWHQHPSARRRRELHQALEQLAMPLPHWREELQRHGAIAQERITAPPGGLSSPSVQLWLGAADHSPATVISTHEQWLGGPHGQSFQGCSFPARQAYAQELMAMGERLGEYLAGLGCRGPVLLDLLAERRGERWKLWAIEINLRKGGTSHPFALAATATDGVFERSSGMLRAADGAATFYEASDALQQQHWRGLLPEQLLDAWVERGLYFNSARRRGCIPHRLGALGEHGLLGATVLGRSRREARDLMRQMCNTAPRVASAHLCRRNSADPR